MKDREQIKEILNLLKGSESIKVWKKIGFTPWSYDDVERTLKWVLK